MFSSKVFFGCALLFALGIIPQQDDLREWTDTSGHYKINARMIACDDEHVVLQKESGNLISFAVKDLCPEDRKFVESAADKTNPDAAADSMKTWTMQNGLRVKGRVVDFANRDVTIMNSRGRVYVNDQPFDNLPDIYQQMIPKFVGHFEKREFGEENPFDRWMKRLTRKGKTYKLEGVMLELPSGDRYAVPFFFFSDADLKALDPMWKRWIAAKEDTKSREKEEFYLRAQEEARHQEKEDNDRRMQQIAEVSLQLQAYDAGLFDLWEVELYPPNGRPAWVVVPGRNSAQATENALIQYPNARVGIVAKVRRRGRWR